MQLCIDRVVGQASFRRLGNSEINHLGHGHAVVHRDKDVRRLDVAVYDALLVCVLDGLADLDEQLQPGMRVEVVLVAVVGDGDAPHQFHHEVGSAQFGGTGIQHPGDVGMVHHRQRLTFRFEARDDGLGVHAQLDDLERDPAPHGFCLFGDIHHAATAFSDALQQLVPSQEVTRCLAGQRFGCGCKRMRNLGQKRGSDLVRGQQGIESGTEEFV